MISLDRRALVGYLALAAGFALAWTVLSGALSPVESAGMSAAAADVPQVQTSGPGQVLFEANCAACHGFHGEGTKDGPALTDSGAAAADFMLRTGRMPLAAPGAPLTRGRPAFDETQITALVAYVAAFGSGPTIPNVQVRNSTDIAAGRQAYVATCAACHGAAATGDAIGGGAFAPSLLATDPTQVGEAIRIGPGQMPRFDSSQVSDEQLSEVAAYLAFLRSGNTAPGGVPVARVGPVAEGYVIWLVYLVVVLLGLIWIGRSRRVNRQ